MFDRERKQPKHSSGGDLMIRALDAAYGISANGDGALYEAIEVNKDRPLNQALWYLIWVQVRHARSHTREELDHAAACINRCLGILDTLNGAPAAEELRTVAERASRDIEARRRVTYSRVVGHTAVAARDGDTLEYDIPASEEPTLSETDNIPTIRLRSVPAQLQPFPSAQMPGGTDEFPATGYPLYPLHRGYSTEIPHTETIPTPVPNWENERWPKELST